MTPLEQLTDAVRASPAHFFEPRAAYRFRSVSQPNLAPGGLARGENPPYGAVLNYWLKEPVKAAGSGDDKEPADKTRKPPVEITILDASGEKIRTLKGTNKAGINRVVWDLRYEASEEVRLRTTPEGNPRVWEEKRFRGMDKRGVYYYGISALRAGPLVVPGTYTVQLSAGGKDFTQQLVVKKDPNSAGTEADVAASTKFSVQIWRDTSATARMINRIEWTRKQIEDFQKMLKAAKAPAADVDAAKDIEKKTRAVEDDLLQPTLAEADLKSFRGPLKLYLSLLWLQAEVGPGAADVSGNADLPPTQPERDVYDLLAGRLSETRRAYEALYEKTIPAFNEAMRSKGYVQLMTVKEPEDLRPDEVKDLDDDDAADSAGDD